MTVSLTKTKDTIAVTLSHDGAERLVAALSEWQDMLARDKGAPVNDASHLLEALTTMLSNGAVRFDYNPEAS